MDFYQNHEIIFDSSFSKEKLTFIQGKGLNDSIKSISIESNEEVHYNGDNTDESIQSKFIGLFDKSGWVHFKNGTAFGVKNGVIDEIKLVKSSLDKLVKLTPMEVESRLGKPTEIEHELITYVFDSVNEGDIYHYKDKGLSIQFDPEGNTIKEIRIK